MEYFFNDNKIYYEASYTNKSNKTIILLHGWGMNIITFREVFKEIARHHNVIAIDLPGFGNSSLNRAYSLDDYSELIKQMIIDLKLNNVVILGHSFGGRILINLNKYNLDQIIGLILVDSAGIKHFNLLTKYKVLKYKTRKKLYKLLSLKQKLKILEETSGSIDYINSSPLLKETMNKTIHVNLKPYLKDIKLDTLILWGKNDYTTPLKDGMIMNENIKNSSLIVFESSGHFPYLDETTKFNLIVLSYLDSLEVKNG